GQVHAEQPQIARGPLEKVLIVALEEIPAATEVLPLGRPDLDDVFAIGDRRLSRELDYAAIRQFETVVGIEGGIVAERLHEVPRPYAPPTAQRRVAVERKSTRLNSSHVSISYAVFCLKKKSSHVAIP